MTRQEFEQYRRSVESQRFIPTATTPLAIGLERGEFEKRKMEQLLSAARTCDALTVRRRAEVYARKLERSRSAKQRFEKLRAEIELFKTATAHSDNGLLPFQSATPH
jgi:hypothetical protein